MEVSTDIALRAVCPEDEPFLLRVYASTRREFLERTPFFSTYGVETGLLIDVFEMYGLSSIAQVDLLERIHHNQSLEALSKMSFVILQAVLRKLERRYGKLMEDVNKTMKLIRHQSDGYFLDIEEIIEHERPPMIEVPEYQEWRKKINDGKDVQLASVPK